MALDHLTPFRCCMRTDATTPLGALVVVVSVYLCFMRVLPCLNYSVNMLTMALAVKTAMCSHLVGISCAPSAIVRTHGLWVTRTTATHIRASAFAIFFEMPSVITLLICHHDCC